MAAKKQYASVSEVLRDAAPDKAFRKEFDEHISERQLIKRLIALRAARGLSQRDIAEKIGCTQSRLSKLENSKDADIKLGDLKAFADAVGCDLPAWPLPRDMKPTDEVKYHTVAIMKNMDELSQLAKSDEKIAEGVARFFFELFVNFSLMLGDSAKRLPCRSDDSPYFDVRLDCDCGDTSDPPRDACNEVDAGRLAQPAS